MRTSPQKAVLILTALLASSVLCGMASYDPNKVVLATVGTQKITLQDLNDRLATYPPQYAEALQQKENKAKVLDQMVDEQLILSAAKKEGIAKTAEYKQQLQLAENQLTLALMIRNHVEKEAEVSDNAAYQYYVQNPQQFAELEQRHASHILVKTEAEALDIQKQLKAGADFATLAKAKSTDPSAANNGGDLGWFGKGQMVPEFEKVAFSLKKGDLSEPVKTQFGYHIIKLIDVQVRPKVDFTPKVAEQIRDALVADKKREITQAYLEKLRKDTKITKNADKL
ncbi:MAG: peptidylprolyl isomerase [Candidatus Margulisiibacteriota bacterium]